MNYKKSVLLKGGAKPKRVDLIQKKSLVGKGGFESKGVFDVSVIIKNKNGRTRRVDLVEKVFKPRTSFELIASPLLKNPLNQFRVVNGLKKLNREKKLGLNILPTVRLKKNSEGKHSLILTKIKNEVKYESLKGKEKQGVDYKLKQIKKTLWKNGYNRHRDIFLFERNQKNGKIIIWIADFGNLYKRKDSLLKKREGKFVWVR